jgi:molecular chaperone DnaJ
VNKTKKLIVKIPEGIDTGEKVRIAGEGEAGIRGGEAGDLYVEVYQKPHKFFKRKKADLYCDATISFVTAALGGAVNIPSINGEELVLNILPGTQNATEIKLKEKGMRLLKSQSRGSIFVNLQIEVPVNLSQRQKELLASFENEMDASSLPKSNGFFKKVKDFWAELNKGEKK